MQVPLLDLKPQMEKLHDEIMEAVTKVIDSTQFILGDEVTALEQSIAAYCAVPNAVGVSSGTDALLISLMAMGVGPGDTVLTSPYTFFATMGSIVRVGARPVFADIDPVTFNINPTAVAEALALDRKNGSRIKALMPVHLFGQCADMQILLQLAEEYRVPVIEDGAQAIGSDCPFTEHGKTTWRRAGSMGISGCFSFFPSKNLGGIGDGGMVTTYDNDFADLLRIYRNHGASPKYHHAYIGGNFRLDTIQACVLDIKLKHLEQWHRDRRQNAQLYTRLFEDARLLDETVTLPAAAYKNVPGAMERNYHIYNQFIIRVPRRDELRSFLQSRDIGCEVYYPVCLHQQECLRPYNDDTASFPEAEQAALDTIALPIYPELRPEQIEYVVQTIKDFYQS